MTNIDRWPEAFENGIPKVGGRWSWNRRAITVKSPMVSGECAVLFDDGMKTTWIPKDFAYDSIAFLGFSDPPAQGAAVPQKPREICRSEGCKAVADVRWMPSYLPICAKHHAEYGIPRGWVAQPIDGSAPIVPPPPSLKAAVQQEGLSIPPQIGVRHEVYEKAGQDAERAGLLDNARASAQKARYALDFDRAYDLEADAIRENRVVRKATLKEMGAGDLACFKARNLREFEAIKSDAHKEWLWWSTVEAPAAPKGNSP